MSRGAYEVAIRRIMVAMDSSTHSLWALEAAAALAGRLEAELLGVFVEDVRLLHLAGLPFSRELAGSSALARELSSSGMERALRVQAQRMRRELMTQAQRVQVQCSFRVLRGEVAGQLLEGVPGADLIILGKMGESPGARRRLGSIAHAVAMRATCSVLLIHPGAVLERPVVVVYDETPAAGRALAMGMKLAESDARHLVVIVCAPDAPRRSALRRRARQWLSRRKLEARFREMPGVSGEDLPDVVRTEGGRVLVMSAETAFAPDEGCEKALGGLDCPVLLVR